MKILWEIKQDAVFGHKLVLYVNYVETLRNQGLYFCEMNTN